MDKIFMFDIDGTLTPSRLQMTEKFLNILISGVKEINTI